MKLFNEYRAIFKDETSKSVVAENIIKASTSLEEKYNENSDNPIIMIKLEKPNVLISEESTSKYMIFYTSSENGNVYPKFGKVLKGSDVIFTAIPIDGYEFERFVVYYNDNELESEEFKSDIAYINIKDNCRIVAYFTEIEQEEPEEEEPKITVDELIIPESSSMESSLGKTLEDYGDFSYSISKIDDKNITLKIDGTVNIVDHTDKGWTTGYYLAFIVNNKEFSWAVSEKTGSVIDLSTDNFIVTTIEDSTKSRDEFNAQFRLYLKGNDDTSDKDSADYILSFDISDLKYNGGSEVIVH